MRAARLASAMEPRHRGALGIAGIALGNLLFALGNWLQDGFSMLVGFQLAAAALMVVLAIAWVRGEDAVDVSRSSGRFALPNVLLGLGAVLALAGLLLVLAVLAG